LIPRIFLTRSPPLGAIIESELLQGDYTMRDAMQMKIALLRREIVEQENGTSAPSKKMF
jgi:hypothetical protein